jgi:hypothetical protein
LLVPTEIRYVSPKWLVKFLQIIGMALHLLLRMSGSAGRLVQASIDRKPDDREFQIVELVLSNFSNCVSVTSFVAGLPRIRQV